MKSVTAFETQPAEWYKTCNTKQFYGEAPYNGKYENENAIMLCDCPCHGNADILHMDACCKFTYRKK